MVLKLLDNSYSSLIVRITTFLTFIENELGDYFISVNCTDVPVKNTVQIHDANEIRFHLKRFKPFSIPEK